MSQNHQRECRYAGTPREHKGVMTAPDCCCTGQKDEPTEEHLAARSDLEWAVQQAIYRANAASDRVARALESEERADDMLDAARLALRQFDARGAHEV